MSALPSPSPAEALLALLRAAAERGAWVEVARLCDEQLEPGWILAQPELGVLRAEALQRLGEFRSALAAAEPAVETFERRGDRAGLRRAINLIGAAHFELGNLVEAEAAFDRALELANTDGDDLLVARATNNLALIANIRGLHDTALTHYQLAVASYQKVGSAAGLAGTFHNMAITYRDLRQLDEADDYERRAIEFAQQDRDRRLRAVARSGRAELSLLRGEARVAEAGARVAAREFAAIPDPMGEADAMRLVGVAREAMGSAEAALEALDRSVALAQQHGSAVIEAESRRARGRVFAAVGQTSRAREDGEAALAIYDRLGAQLELALLKDWLDAL